MEGWRSWGITQKMFGDKYKHEPREPKQIEDRKFPPALYIDVTKGRHLLVLYQPTKRQKWFTPSGVEIKLLKPMVIAMIILSKTSEECIPDTMQVNFSAVAKNYQGEGYGSLIYGLAFHYANNIMGSGLTSDHTHSTSEKAQKLWNKYADTKEMIKKKTKGKHPRGGHDTFDYTSEKTPEDKYDDCDDGHSVEYLATHNSWVMKGNRFQKSFNELSERSQHYVELAKDSNKFKKELQDQSRDLFQTEYNR